MWRIEHEWTVESVLNECMDALDTYLNEYIDGRNAYDQTRDRPLFGPQGIPHVTRIGTSPVDDLNGEFISPSVSLMMDIDRHTRGDATNFLHAECTLDGLVLLSEHDAGTTDPDVYLNIMNAYMSGCTFILSTKVGKNPSACYRTGLIDLIPKTSSRDPLAQVVEGSTWLRMGEFKMDAKIRIWDHGG